MSRAALYARVSSEQQDADDKTSLQEQLAEMVAHCERRGLTIVECYQEVGSGATRKHSEFLRMLADARTGRFDTIAQNPLTLSGLGEAASAKPSGPLPVSPHWGAQGLRASGATHLQYRPSYVDLSATARSRYSLPRRRPRLLGGSRRGSCPTVVPLHRGGDGWQPWFRLRQG